MEAVYGLLPREHIWEFKVDIIKMGARAWRRNRFAAPPLSVLRRAKEEGPSRKRSLAQHPHAGGHQFRYLTWEGRE